MALDAKIALALLAAGVGAVKDVVMIRLEIGRALQCHRAAHMVVGQFDLNRTHLLEKEGRGHHIAFFEWGGQAHEHHMHATRLQHHGFACGDVDPGNRLHPRHPVAAMFGGVQGGYFGGGGVDANQANRGLALITDGHIGRR